MEWKLTNIYGNDASPKSIFKASHGNSFLLEVNSTLMLFDVGWHGNMFLHNLSVLKHNPDEISTIIFSHGHKDHTGGLQAFLKMRTSDEPVKIIGHPAVIEKKAVSRMKGKIQIPFGLNLNKKIIRSRTIFEAHEEPFEIYENLWFSGEITHRMEPQALNSGLRHHSSTGWTQDPLKDDGSLIIQGNHGVSIVCGCGHAGLLNICNHVHTLFPQMNIEKIIGGTHMVAYDEPEINRISSILQQIYHSPDLYLNHCTGSKALSWLSATYPSEKLHKLFVGDQITIN